jgi:ornithine cyclodeaminase
MREADDAALQRARIFADDRTGVLSEAGELVQAIAAGAIRPEAVLGDLGDLARGTVRGRTRPDEITLFKSVGTARADLAAAALLVSRLV